MEKFEVTITFLLDEEVTPELFARRVAMACGKQYALRPGEGLRTESMHDGSPLELFVRETTDEEKAAHAALLASLGKPR
jgi:hypothetical protein